MIMLKIVSIRITKYNKFLNSAINIVQKCIKISKHTGVELLPI